MGHGGCTGPRRASSGVSPARRWPCRCSARVTPLHRPVHAARPRPPAGQVITRAGAYSGTGPAVTPHRQPVRAGRFPLRLPARACHHPAHRAGDRQPGHRPATLPAAQSGPGKPARPAAAWPLRGSRRGLLWPGPGAPPADRPGPGPAAAPACWAPRRPAGASSAALAPLSGRSPPLSGHASRCPHAGTPWGPRSPPAGLPSLFVLPSQQAGIPCRVPAHRPCTQPPKAPAPAPAQAVGPLPPAGGAPRTPHCQPARRVVRPAR